MRAGPPVRRWAEGGRRRARSRGIGRRTLLGLGGGEGGPGSRKAPRGGRAAVHLPPSFRRRRRRCRGPVVARPSSRLGGSRVVRPHTPRRRSRGACRLRVGAGRTLGRDHAERRVGCVRRRCFPSSWCPFVARGRPPLTRHSSVSSSVRPCSLARALSLFSVDLTPNPSSSLDSDSTAQACSCSLELLQRRTGDDEYARRRCWAQGKG